VCVAISKFEVCVGGGGGKRIYIYIYISPPPPPIYPSTHPTFPPTTTIIIITSHIFDPAKLSKQRPHKGHTQITETSRKYPFKPGWGKSTRKPDVPYYYDTTIYHTPQGNSKESNEIQYISTPHDSYLSIVDIYID